MNQFVLTCCSTADKTKEYFERRNIPYACFHYTMDGAEYPDDLGQTMPFDEFYQRIADGAMPVTSQVNVSEFTAFFESFLKEGRDVLHICLSSGISGTYNSACIAGRELSVKYPDRKIIIIDSLGASSGFGLLVDAAADLRDAGKSLDDTAAWVEANKLKIHHWFFTSDLSHLKRGGRISAASAMVGSVLNICPLMNIDSEGHLVPRYKIRTKKKVIAEMIKQMEDHALGGADYSGKCFISYSACYEDARAVANLVEERFTHLNGPVMIDSIGAVIGAHTGPGTVALFFFGDERVD